MIYNREGRFTKLVVWSEMHRIGTEENVASEEVWAIQEKHWNDTKDVLRLSQELADPFAFQALTCRV